MYSNEHKEYIKRIRTNNTLIRIIRKESDCIKEDNTNKKE